MTSPTQTVRPPSFKELAANTGSGAGGKYFAFKDRGDSITGKIISVQVLQARDIATKELQTWQSGEPKWQVAISLQTNLTDPEDVDDDGRRAVYFKWWGDQRTVLQQAMDAAGVDDFAPGGRFTATYVGDNPPARPGLFATKRFEVQYEKPSAMAVLQDAKPAQYANGGVVGTPSYTPGGGYEQPPVTTTDRTVAAATTAPVTPPAAPAATPDLAAQFGMIKTLLAGGMSVEQIAGATNMPLATVQAVALAPSA